KRVFSWLAIGPAFSNFIGPFAAGLLIDYAGAQAGDLTGYRFAFGLMALLPAALLTLLRGSDIVEGRLTLSLALVFLATFLYNGIFLAMLALTGQRVEWLPSFVWVMIPGAVLNTAVMPPVYWVIRRTAVSARRPTAYEAT
ncbi:MAG: hypothetical protein NTZ05_21730, partial [Chloroflexi bacterium]|nr:hypothetical protein [Chloroflexota bacterium]